MPKKRKPWHKNLYDNSSYEDNYTDPTFLQDLKTNLNVRFFTFTEITIGVTLLNNQISCITCFLILFYLLYSEQITPTSVFISSLTATLVGYIVYRGRELNIPCIVEDSKTLLAVLIFGYLSAPLLHRLTDAISTDTIFSMTFVVMLLNLIFFDYGPSVAMVSKAISLNAAIFGSICLASRLSTSYHAFVLLVEAAIFFVLYPMLTLMYWRWYYLIPIMITCLYLLFNISKIVFFIYLTIIFFINIFCPWVFVMQQQHKNNIHGPWDEAVVIENLERCIDEKL